MYLSSYLCRDGNAHTPHLFASFVTYLPRNSYSLPPPLPPNDDGLPFCCPPPYLLLMPVIASWVATRKSPCNPDPANNRKATWRRPPSPSLVLYLTWWLSFLLIPMMSMVSVQLGISKPTNIYQNIFETWKLYKPVQRYLDILKQTNMPQ